MSLAKQTATLLYFWAGQVKKIHFSSLFDQYNIHETLDIPGDQIDRVNGIFGLKNIGERSQRTLTLQLSHHLDMNTI